MTLAEQIMRECAGFTLDTIPVGAILEIYTENRVLYVIKSEEGSFEMLGDPHTCPVRKRVKIYGSQLKGEHAQFLPRFIGVGMTIVYAVIGQYPLYVTREVIDIQCPPKVSPPVEGVDI